MAKSHLAGLFLIAAGCMSAESALEIEPRSGGGATTGLDARFAELHQKYVDADGDYIPLLRATLRHARRLLPSECLAAQSDLVDYGGANGYDGLEPLWLIYQDCVASGSALTIGLGRAANFADFQAGLHYTLADPHPQVFPRVSHYNARIDRGVRGDALRGVLAGHAAQSTGGSWTSLHALLRNSNVVSNLCAIPMRLNQFGDIADSELLRHATCAAGVGSNLHDVCGQLFPPGQSGAQVQGLSAADSARLEGLCNRMGGATGASVAGVDMLDGFSSDWCLSESAGRVSAEEVPGLIMDCYFGNEGSASPVALGGVTSANFQDYIDEVVVWDDANGIPTASYTFDDPSTEMTNDGVRMAHGETEGEAYSNLVDQLFQDPPPGFEVSVNEEGHKQLEASGDGYATLITLGEGDTWESLHVEWDDQGRLTKETTTTKDAEGNVTTVTRTIEYDDDGNATEKVTQSTSPSTPGNPDGFDPTNPACQELMALGMAFGSRDEMFDALYERGTGLQPEVINPSPDDDSTWGEAPSCGAMGLGGNGQQQHCASPVMCEEGSVLNEDCLCEQQGGTVPARGCIEVTCANGTYPVPVGAFGCDCVAHGQGGANLPPAPDPTALMEMTEEFVWNRPEGEIVVTPEMEHDFNGGQPPV